MLDFEMIMKDRGYWKDKNWHQTKHQYSFETGTIIEFISMDNYGKAHGPRRDILYVNECNNLEYKIVQQLMLRTRKIVWLDWNPSSEFWYYTELEGKRDDIDFLHLTYLDNEALDQGTLSEIMSMKGNKYLWDVYGLGILGEVEGKIYKNWRILEEIPQDARLRRKGLDYGYTNDPSALIDIYRWNNAFVLDELLYKKGLSNRQIADTILATEQVLVIGDSAEPKSNDEIKDYGVNIVGSLKGNDSVLNGIQFVQDQRIYITKRSINLIREYRNYLWMVDKNGKILNEPEHAFSHSMDAIRYGIASFIKPKKKTGQSSPSWTNSRWAKK